MLAIVLCNINRTNMKCICLIKLENLQCYLRSLENVNNELVHSYKDNKNELYNKLVPTIYHSLVFIANTVRCRPYLLLKCESAAFWVRENL